MRFILPLVLGLVSCSGASAKRVVEVDSGSVGGGTGGSAAQTGGRAGIGGRSTGGGAGAGTGGVAVSRDAGTGGAGGAPIEDASQAGAVDSGGHAAIDASVLDDSGTNAPIDSGRTDARAPASGCTPSGETPGACGTTKSDPYKYWWGCQGPTTPVPDLSGTKQCQAASGTPPVGMSAWCCIPQCARSAVLDSTCSTAYPYGWQCVGGGIPNSETPTACTGSGGAFCCDETIGKPPPT